MASRWISLPGLTLALTSDVPTVTDAIEKAFQLLPGAPSKTDIRLTVRTVDFDAVAALLPPWARKQLPLLKPHPEPVFLYGPHNQAVVFFMGAQNRCVEWVFWNRHLEFVCCKQPGKETSLSVTGVLVPVLREIWLQRRYLLLHAAALKCPQGTGVGIFADSGGGKTTLSLALMRHQAQLLADDLILLQQKGSGVHIYGIPELLNIAPATTSYFPELASVFADAPKKSITEDKRKLVPQDIYGKDCMCPETDLEVAYFVDICPEGPAVEALAPQDAFGRILKAATFARKQRFSPEAAELVFSLAGRVKSYLLHTGKDPVRLGSWLMAHCRQHAGSEESRHPGQGITGNR
jgi:hypothetical protein